MKTVVYSHLVKYVWLKMCVAIKTCTCNTLNTSIYKTVAFFYIYFALQIILRVWRIFIHVMGDLIFVLIKLSALKYIFFKTVIKMSLSMIETYRIFNRNILFLINLFFYDF